MKSWRSFIVIAIVVILMIGCVVAIVRYLVLEKQAGESIWSQNQPIATTTENIASSTTLSFPLPSATTTVPSSWKNYSNDELGFSVSYPPELIINQDGAVLALAFPKNKYFHWPLQDDAKIAISVASTCPMIEKTAIDLSVPTTTFSLNGYSFSRSEGHEAAAGNLYNEWVYDTLANGSCYRVSLSVHGANGAGLYVDDQALINRYDGQHATDLNAVMDIWNVVTASFRIRQIPAGTPEDQVPGR